MNRQSTLEYEFSDSISKIWTVVTDNSDYSWRSDIDHIIDEILKYLDLIEKNSDDKRILIKKAASRALRKLGKTDEEAKELSIKTAKEMLKQNSKAKQWVAKDALKELETLVKAEGRNRLISLKSKMGQQISK